MMGHGLAMEEASRIDEAEAYNLEGADLVERGRTAAAQRRAHASATCLQLLHVRFSELCTTKSNAPCKLLDSHGTHIVRRHLICPRAPNFGAALHAKARARVNGKKAPCLAA